MDALQKPDAERPADKAVRLLGVKAIAHACDLTTDAVYKWGKIGGGRIPAKHLAAVVNLAREREVEFSAEDAIGVAA